LVGDVNTWIIWFNYESSTCTNPVTEPTGQTLTGASLKANNSASDFALVMLDETPPLNYNVYYNGWSNINTAPSSSVVIHHPSGDIKKISYENNQAISDTYADSPANSHWRVVWDDGTTEGGSSGAPLIDQNHRIVGQLHGGYASCSEPDEPDWFGKFSMSWNYGSSPSTRLRDWLDPDNTGATVLDGLEDGMLSAGELPANATWSGTHTLTGNITVPQGVTLTILPGSYIRTNSQIIVQGTLAAQGAEASPITFNSISGGWIGLEFENSSDDLNCILEYCDIKNASYGVYTDNAAPTIKNCTIRYNLYGIYENAPSSQTIENNEICYNTYWGVLIMSPSSSMIIDNNDFHNYGRNLFLYNCDYATSVLDNKIHDSGYNSEGIYMWASSPILLNNFIYDNGGHGINCIYDSDPEFWYDNYTGNNVVAYNNFQGVKIDNSSVPILGGLNEDDEPASNSFYDNGNYDVYSEQSSTIDATYNYWKYATPDVYGNVNTAYALSSDPNPDPHNLSKSMAEITGVNNLDTTIDSVNAKARALFDKGLDFELKKQYSAAIGLYKNVISTYPDAFEASLAIVHINKCYNKLQNINEGRDYIRQIANSHQNKLGYKARELNAKWLQKAKKFDEALTEYNQIINNMPNSLMVKNALLNKWLIYFNIKKNKQTARSIMTDFENSFPDDEWTLFMKVALGDITPDNAPELPNRKKPFNKETLGEEQITVKQFALYRNYPNPFNPDTRIKYDIPEADHVTLQIFDIQGREVARLVNSQKNAGRHVAIWNSKDKYGSQAASGVYFYRIRYRDYVVTRKMVLAR